MCGYQHQVIQTCDVRVNKNSLRMTGTSLISAGRRYCPECGQPNVGGLVPISPWRLIADDAAKVSEYRQRKWGVSDPPGPLVEARQKRQRGEEAAA